ncbi:hypothetical protein Droror1_Dr00018362 [Drosera rotundifolia]
MSVHCTPQGFNEFSKVGDPNPENFEIRTSRARQPETKSESELEKQDQDVARPVNGVQGTRLGYMKSRLVRSELVRSELVKSELAKPMLYEVRAREAGALDVGAREVGTHEPLPKKSIGFTPTLSW